MKHPIVWLLVALPLWLTGCITETTGGHSPKSDDERVQARLDLARGYIEAGQLERARPALKRALEIDSRSVEANVLMALLNESENDIGLAEKHYKYALRADSSDPQALNNYASFLYSQGRYEDAVGYLRDLVKNSDYRARSQAYENLGLAELKIDEVDLAKRAFSRSLELNFAQPRSSLELADLALADQDYQAAESYYEGFRSQARQTPRSLCLGMKLAKEAGESDRLASYRLALNNLYPDSPQARQCMVGN